MKHLIWLLFISHPLCSLAQDIIETKDDSTIQVRIVQEEKKEVHFYPFHGTDRSLSTLSKDQVKKVSYEEIPRNTNTILIESDSLQGEDLFASVTRYLLQSGYAIGVFNKDALIVETDYSKKQRVSLDVNGDTIIFNSFYTEAEVKYPPVDQKNTVWGKVSTPEEKRVTARHRSFRRLDELCRKYLMINKGRIYYTQD